MAEPLRALIVEDSPSVRLYLEALVRKWGFDTSSAADGAEAWELLQSRPIHLLISDWMMPRLSGLELCRRVRAAALPHYVYTILVTARSESADLLEGMSAGADDFLSKPVDARELQVRVEAARRVLLLEMTLEERNRRLSETNAALERAYRSMRRDVEAAAFMQRSLLPRPGVFGGLQLQGMFLPAALVAGDFYGYFPLEDGGLAFYHVDVAGHGVPAAMFSFSLSRVLDAAAAEGAGRAVHFAEPAGRELLAGNPAAVVADLNRRFQAIDEILPYFTMVYGVIDAGGERLTLCQAGHPRPLLISARGEVTVLGGAGFPVGLLPEATYDEIEVALQPGDRIVIYSDGATDAERGAEGGAFGLPRLCEQLAAGAALPLPALLERLEQQLRGWCDGREFEDDVSVLALERLCAPLPGAA